MRAQRALAKAQMKLDRFGQKNPAGWEYDHHHRGTNNPGVWGDAQVEAYEERRLRETARRQAHERGRRAAEVELLDAKFAVREAASEAADAAADLRRVEAQLRATTSGKWTSARSV